MAKNAGNAGMGRPPKLRADAETLLKLNHFGLKGLASKETARRLGVHDGTLRRLFAWRCRREDLATGATG
jgi:hypothetical protein